MTGKLADKLPLTMSSLINTIPDSLYPEEDIPTSMNIFTSTDSINHYSQMNTGKNLTYYVCFFIFKVFETSRLFCNVRVRALKTATVVLVSGHLFAPGSSRSAMRFLDRNRMSLSSNDQQLMIGPHIKSHQKCRFF